MQSVLVCLIKRHGLMNAYFSVMKPCRSDQKKPRKKYRGRAFNPMKTKSIGWLAAALVCLTVRLNAATLYVDLNCTNPIPPYADWSTAATNIQNAVDASTNGDLILVTNGVYQTGGRVAGGMTNRLAVTKAVTVQSINGPAMTVIQGYQVPGTTNGTNAVRCVFLTNNAVLIGFTVTNGATYPFFGGGTIPQTVGGGVFCNSSNSIVSNCVIVGNSAADAGGGVGNGTINDSVIMANSSDTGGGVCSDDIVTTLNNCLVVSNYASDEGGGVFACRMNNCLITGNIAGFRGGGAVDIGYLQDTWNNCTIVGNSATYGGGAVNGTLNNCIVYYNNGTNSNYYAPAPFPPIILNYCCTTPLPSGPGNITNEPAFVNLAGGDFHLQSSSPCINSGNNAFVSITNDLDGNARIAGGTVDIGAYEYQAPSSILSYAWAQQYGLPTDGSADYLDLDGTGMNNWQKWIAGLNPTNPASLLVMTSSAVSTNIAGVTMTWQSVNTRTYYLQRSTDLTASPQFSAIQGNIVGQAGTTSFTDATATNDGPYFYRVGVQ
jgi:hypothetical protein